MYKLEFTLKQHTPIIHFQGEQDGATIRATEIKPKFDTYLHKVLKEATPKWNVDKDHAALNYKLIINITNVSSELSFVNNDKIPPYFGNLGNSNDSTLTFSNSLIECKIISIHKDLVGEIEKHLTKFFQKSNFGTRQSKGFGSFLVYSINGKGIANDLHNQFRYKFNITVGTGNWKKSSLLLFEQLDWFYRSLRSGINHQGNNEKLYFKSALFMYLHYSEPSIQWDKKTLKSQYLDKQDIEINEYNKKKRQDEKVKINFSETQNIRHKMPDILSNRLRQDANLTKKNYRDLFGLSTEESWRSYRANITKKRVDNFGEEIEETEVDIERYTSPILFKPINNGDGTFTVYFDVFLEGTEKRNYYDKRFKYNMSSKAFELSHLKQNNLIMPIADDFNFDAFFEYAFNRIDIEKHIIHSNCHTKAQNLIEIYRQLRHE